MIAEHKGPIVLSATVHFVLLLALLIASMIIPTKAPEPFVFEMYGDPGPQGADQLPTLSPLEYESQDEPEIDPKIFEPEIPEPEAEPVQELVPYEEPTPEPVAEVVSQKPKLISYDEFGVVEKPQNIRKTPIRRKVDLSSFNREVQDMIAKSRSSETVSSLGSGDKRSLEAYLNSLGVAIRDAVEPHTAGAVPLVTEVRFLVAANGSVTGVRIVKSSGDSGYDKKVLEAFRTSGVRRFLPTPFGNAHDLNLAVRQQD